MGRRGRKSKGVRCRVCGLKADVTDQEIFFRGRCKPCRTKAAEQRRHNTGQKLIDKAKPAGVEIRDGREYTVTVLPPKRRGGWK